MFSEGLAVDWIHNHIYWTDTKLKRIEVANINGGQRTILFSGINNLRDIIVDPINRFVLYTLHVHVHVYVLCM